MALLMWMHREVDLWPRLDNFSVVHLIRKFYSDAIGTDGDAAAIGSNWNETILPASASLPLTMDMEFARLAANFPIQQ